MVPADPGLLGDDLVDLVHHLLGAAQRRRVGKLGGDHDVALVLRRDEAGGQAGDAEVGRHQQADEQDDDEQRPCAASRARPPCSRSSTCPGCG